MTLASLLDHDEAKWVLERTITTNRGELAVYGDSSGTSRPMVVKREPTWTSRDSAGLARTVHACRLHALAHGDPPFVPALRGWGDDPPYVAIDLIDGTNLNATLADELAGLRADDATSMAIASTRAMAQLVARFHQAMTELDAASWDLPSKSGTTEETGAALRLIGLLRGPRHLERAFRVRSIDDPGPHNTVVDTNGGLWLIDLPADAQDVMVERDVARLISRVVASIHRPSSSRWIPYHPVVDAVIEGYQTIRAPEGRSVDRSLVYACLAADAALKVVFTRRRLPPGTRLECFVRESYATVTLATRALWLRVRGSR